MLTVSIHPVDDAHREIAVQLTTFIPSPLFHEVLDSDYGLLVDLPEEGFQSLPLVFKHSSLSQSRRLLKKRRSTPDSTVLVWLQLFFFFSLLHLRLITIMSLNRTKSAGQSALVTTWGKNGHVRPILQLERGSWLVPTAHDLIWYLGSLLIESHISQDLRYYCACVVLSVNN